MLMWLNMILDINNLRNSHIVENKLACCREELDLQNV